MPRFCSVVLIGLIGLAAFPAIVRADKPADVLAANHLQATGGVGVLSGETEVIDGMKSLRKDKKQVDEDKRLRKQYDAKIASSRGVIAQNRKEFTTLQDRLSVIQDVSIHNRMVIRMNMLALKAKEASEAMKEAEDKENQMSIDPETKYVDGLLSLQAKSSAISEKYQELASNSAVKTALAQSTPRLTVGPSKDFTDAVADLKKWGADVESEAIPITEHNGVLMVKVLVNGEQQNFFVDPGASMVTLPGELAEKLKLAVTDQDPVIQMKLADGNIIEGRRISLKSVRVGRFTVENVPCVVLAKGLNDAPPLLGNSFLSHFVVKIDQKAGQMHLVDVAKSETTTIKSVGTADHDTAGKIEQK